MKKSSFKYKNPPYINYFLGYRECLSFSKEKDKCSTQKLKEKIEVVKIIFVNFYYF